MVVNTTTALIKDFFTSKAPIDAKVTVDILSDGTSLFRHVVINYDDVHYLKIQTKEELLCLVNILNEVSGYISELDLEIK